MAVSNFLPHPDYRVNLANTNTAHPSHWAWFAIHSIANLYSFSASFRVSESYFSTEVIR